jgi:hypothetical protein
MKENTKLGIKLGALVVASALVGAGVIAGVNHSDVSLEQANALVAAAQLKSFQEGKSSVVIPAPVVVEKLVNVTVEKQVPVTVEKLVDNGKMAAVMQAIYDNDGKVEFVIDGLKDSEVSQIADRFVLVNDFKSMAIAEVKKNLADLVDKEVVSGSTIDDKDVERVRLNDDANEIVVDDIDFEDKDATLLVSGTFEAEDVKYEFEVSVDIKDGEVDDSSLESLDLA